MRQIISFNNKNVILPEPWVPSGPANNEIWYTSSDGNVVAPYRESSLPTIVSNTYVDGKGVIKFASDITSIGTNAFNGCKSLTSVMIPNSVTFIGSGAFYGCSGLTSINIPNSITSIGKQAFKGCSSLSSVIIPNSVTIIRDWAFNGCTGLTSLTIGNSVKNIARQAFNGCSGLTSISYTGTITQWNNITKGSYWHFNVPATVVHCTDGDAPI